VNTLRQDFLEGLSRETHMRTERNSDLQAAAVFGNGLLTSLPRLQPPELAGLRFDARGTAAGFAEN